MRTVASRSKIRTTLPDPPPKDDVLYPLSYIRDHGHRGGQDSVRRCTDPEIQQFAADVFDKLLTDKPKKARKRDKFGAIALHYAAKGDKFAPANVEALLKHFPGGAAVPDNDGWLPLHYACTNPRVEAISALLATYPTAARVRNRMGELAIHYAADSEDFDAPEAVRILLEHYPDGAKVKNQLGRTPLQQIVSKQSSSEQTGKVVAHLIKAHPEGLLDRDPVGNSSILELVLTNWSEVAKAEGTKALLTACPQLAQIPCAESDTLPLHLACCFGGFHFEHATQLLDALVTAYPEAVEHIDGHGKLAIHYAAKLHDGVVGAAMLRQLVIGDPEGGLRAAATPDASGMMPLHYTCGWRHPTGMIKFMLLHHPDASLHADNQGNLPVHHMASCVSEHAVSNLNELQRVYPPGIKKANRQGELPLHLGCMNAGPWAAELVVQLIRHHPEATYARDREENYALHHASKNEGAGAEAIVNELLRAGLNMNCCDKEDRQGMLPMHLAARNQGPGAGAMFHEMLRVFPEGVRHQDRGDMLPLHHAVANESRSGMEIVVECLAAYPEGALHCDRMGMLPMHHAVTNLSPDGVAVCLEVLSKAPLSVIQQDREGRLPLHHACLSTDPYHIVDMLLREYPEAANVADMNGMLPLHWAARNSHPEAKDLVDQLLCASLAAAQVEDKDGMLAVHYACQNDGTAKAVFIDALLSAYPEAVSHADDKVNGKSITVNYVQKDMLSRVMENTRVEQTLKTLE